jgi:hypothetical protein
MTWTRVTTKNPCPICGKPDWCTITPDGTAASCMRIQSDKPLANGGYLHRIGAQPAYKPTVRQFRAPPPCSLDFAAMMDAFVRNTPQDALQAFAASLGVDVLALASLGAGRHNRQAAWAFPMRNGDGKTVGIRLRFDDGDKRAVTGSKEGLFYADGQPADNTAVVCEGPTDTAAALTLGLWAIGRPSCQGAVDHTSKLCKRLRINRLLVMADNDAPKKLPNGKWWQPGFDGAKKLVTAIGLPYRMIAPPTKDIRAWVRAGATRADFDFLANSTREIT